MSTTLLQASLSGAANSGLNLSAYVPQSGDVNAVFTDANGTLVFNTGGAGVINAPTAQTAIYLAENAGAIPNTNAISGSFTVYTGTDLGDGVGVCFDTVANLSTYWALYYSQGHMKLLGVVSGSVVANVSAAVTASTGTSYPVTFTITSGSPNTISVVFNGTAVSGLTNYAASGLNPSGNYIGCYGNSGGTQSTNLAAVTIQEATTAATSFTLTGPSSGLEGSASTNFTYTLNGNFTGSITPTMTGLAGAWSPNVLTWSGTSTAQTATFTPSAVGTGQANGTASPSLTQPSNVAYTSTAPATATTLSLSSSTTVGQTPITLTVGANGPFSGSLSATFSDGGLGGTFSSFSPITSGTTGTVTYTPSSTASGNVTLTATLGGLIPASQPLTISAATYCLSSVAGAFATGLISTSGFGYQISVNGGSYGSLLTANIVEDSTNPVTYTARIAVTPAALIKILWSNGSGIQVVDANPQFVGGGSGGGGSNDFTVAPTVSYTTTHAGASLLSVLTATGSNQSTAKPIPPGEVYAEFAVVPSGSGAILSGLKAPSIAYIQNSGANALSVYPPVGGTLGAGVNVPTTLAAGASAIFWASHPSVWHVA